MEVDREMTREEIEEEFDGEWVLINDPVHDENTRFLLRVPLPPKNPI